MLSAAKLFETSQDQLDHDRLMALINSLSDGFLAVSEEGIIELSNGVALSMLDTNSLLGKKINEAMPIISTSDDVINPLLLVPNAASNFNSRDYRLAYTDGTIVHLYINVSVVRSGFGKQNRGGYVFIFRDITKEKTAEEERDEFISVASHELRNPVAVAEGSISNAILLSEKASVDDNIVSVLKSAHEQIMFLGSLINDLAMVSRADRARLAESAEEFDAAVLINALQSDYQERAKQKGLVLSSQIEELPKLYGSRLYTREILQNFVTNAIKYTEKGSITIRASANTNGVDLSVTDTGIGIDKEEQRKVFTKFFRSDDSRVRKISGTGLGLYVSQKLARLMNGSITMNSEINQGSTFTLHLPLAAASKEVAKLVA
ncbi:PAS domain-containing sensor histidine kinase [Candidatus Saccharibacteria bacterium]|nr:PAS domain-containing sensor histidine kinase [Candidatus Saccharibacteria bacterium]